MSTAAPRSGPVFVALGSVEFDVGWLEGPGADLTDVLRAVAGAGGLRWAMPDDVRARLPRSGWHRVEYSPAELDGDHPRGTSATFAAPAPGIPGRWVVLTMTGPPQDESPALAVVTADAVPVRLRPARAARVAGLELRWPHGPVVAVAGTVPQPVIRLHNTGDRTWMPDPDDGSRVLGYLRDLDGNPESFFAWFPAGPGAPLPEIPPGGHVELPVTLSKYLVEDTPPGSYVLHADLPSLGLGVRTRPVQLLDGSAAKGV